MSQTNLVELTGVYKRYGRKEVLSNISLQVPEGGVAALIGENGAGKSTIIRIVNGLSRPTAGTVALLGATDSRSLCKARSRIGFVPDDSGAYQDLSARDNLVVRCAEWGLSTAAVTAVLKTVGLSNTGKLKVKHFSMGMKRRLDIATALLGDSQLIIMDEPINGLDPLGIVEIREIIQRLHQEGRTILLSSHNLDELDKVATMYTFISHGRVIESLSSEKLDEDRVTGLALRVDDAQVAQEKIRQVDKAARVDTAPDGRLAVSGLTIGADRLVEALVRQGLSVCEVRPRVQSLESYYLALLKGGAADAQSAA